MPEWLSRELSRWTPRAFWMLAGCVLLFPGQADAGCTHVVPTVEHFEHLAALGALGTTADSTEPWKPCSGPQCKNGGGLPPAPLVLIALSKVSAFLNNRPLASQGPGTLLAAPSSDAVPMNPPVSIFHPPRFT
jgi:hypothetical protein